MNKEKDLVVPVVTKQNEIYTSIDTKALHSPYLNTPLVGYQSLLEQQPPSLTNALYDNCCSFSVTGNLDYLFDIVSLPEPIHLSGINGGILLTHSARFLCLPSANGFDRGYYSSKLQTTLFSLGYFQKCGATYNTTKTHNGIDIYTPDGILLDSPDLSQFNLYPISSTLLDSTYFDSSPTKPAGHAFVTHINAEQKHRCEDVEQLLHRLGFPTDESLIADISGGKIPTFLTGTDVRLNRQLRGPCPHQLAGKARAPVAPSSTSAPATTIGGNVSFDIQILLDPPPGGRTHEIIFYDEFSGLFGHELCYSKSQNHVLDAINSFVANNFTIYGHKVTEFHGDDERINSSLRTPLAKLGIKITLSLPGQHARFVERCIETIRSRSCSILSRLSYEMPLKYTPLLHSAVVKLLNRSINTRSSPFTPWEIVAGRKYTDKTIPYPFGSCHMVSVAIDKRRRQALRANSQFRYMPKVEVGVCLGPDPLNSNGFLFVTANGSIGAKVVHSALDPSFVPFDWITKLYVPIITIPAHRFIEPTASLPVNITPVVADDNTNTDVPNRDENLDNPNIDITDVTTDVTSIDPSDNDVAVPNVLFPTPTTILTEVPTRHQPSRNRRFPHSIAQTMAQRIIDQRTQQQQQTATLPSPIVSAINPTPEPASSVPWQRPPRNRRLPQRLAHMMVQNTPIRNTFDELTDPDDEDIDKPIATSIVSSVDTNKIQSETIRRKLVNQRKNTARNAAYRRSLKIDHLNDRPASNEPSPPPPTTRTEVSVKQAILLWGADLVNAAVEIETNKILVTYRSMRPIQQSQMAKDGVYLRSMLLIKQKSNGTISARMPIDGSHQPTDSYGDTFAETTDITDRLFLLSIVLKDAADRKCLDELDIFTGDIPAAFINGNTLDQGKTGDRKFYTKFPMDHPDPTLAGQWMEVVGAQYGMKQANNIYDQDLDKTMLTNTGYISSPLHPRLYVKRNKEDLGKYSMVIFYSDDFEHFGTCPKLKQAFKDLMTTRYGPNMKFCDPGVGTTGLEYTQNENHSITVTVSKYIEKLLKKAGMDAVEPSLQPSLPNFFRFDTSSPPLDFKSAAHFRTINGGLVWILPVRFDICKEVRWLCTRNKAPTDQDRAKQVQLLRYLKGAPNIGPTFNGKTLDAPGIRIEGASDVGHSVHPDNGASQIAFQVSVGETNAPFKVSSFAESGLISPDPTSAEYLGLGCVTKEVLYWRQVAESIGFPQEEPSIIRQDNNSAINLTVAPQVTRRMRFTAIRHHHVRSAYKMKLIRPVYTNTNSLGSTDMHTKSSTVSSPNQFLYNRSVLFNDRGRTYQGNIAINTKIG